MPSLEAVCGRLFNRSGWIPKVLWGGGLCFIPILNLIAFGYLVEFTRRLRRSNHWELPEWNEMEIPRLFLEGLRMLLLVLAYVGLPMLFAWLLSFVLLFLSFGLLGIVSFFPIAIAGFFGPFLFLSALHTYLRDQLFSDAWKVREVFQSALPLWPRLAIPVVAFWGVFLLALPLYGMSFFIGTWVLLAHSTALQFER